MDRIKAGVAAVSLLTLLDLGGCVAPGPTVVVQDERPRARQVCRTETVRGPRGGVVRRERVCRTVQ
jgi:hypothetical protein